MTAKRTITKLRQLDDVPAAAPADGQVAAYNSGTGIFAWADAGGGGGSGGVGVMLRAEALSITHGSGQYHRFSINEILDNTYDQNTLSALPSGLGLDITPLDGSGESEIIALEDGAWYFGLNAVFQNDPTVYGFMGVLGADIGDWNFGPGIAGPGGVTIGSYGAVIALPAGAEVEVAVVLGDFASSSATANPWSVNNPKLILVRIA